ncbi:MAG: TRAP transporter large permease [Limnochordia bacterium]|jgi:tripartite ATP-independent transporter DctM subunit
MDIPAIVILIGLLVPLMLIGLPIAYCMGATSILYLFYTQGFFFNYQIVAQRMLYGINNFTLIAVPFFIFAAQLMNTGGITRRLFRFANILVGHLPGGLGQVNIIASVIFAGMSGAAVSDAAGLGTIEIEAMLDAGYDVEFSAAITAASSTIGPIIPPSIPMVLYGVSAGTSVGALLLAGLVPGLVMAVCLMVMVAIYAKGRNYPTSPRPTLHELAQGFVEALPPLMTPVIIIGGIYWGWFTPTEASVVAAAYAFILSCFLYRELPLADVPNVVVETMRQTVSIALISSAASIYGWLILRSGIPMYFADLIPHLATTQIGTLFVIIVFLLIVGMFMEPVSAILILCPILVPYVKSMGIDLVHFGVIMVLTLMIGLLTPPVGIVLYVLQGIANISFDRLVKAVMPFLIPLLIALVIVTLVPGLTTWLPRLAMR